MTRVNRVAKVAGFLLAVAGSAAAGVVVGGQAREPVYPKMVVANKPDDAVPVSAVVTGMPVVQVESGVVELGAASIALLKEGAVVRLMPPEWEYRELKAPTSPGVYRSLLTELSAAGAEGWETAGLMFSDADATVVILKRQKLPTPEVIGARRPR